MKSYVSLNIFVNPLTTDNTEADAVCWKLSSVTVKLATKDIEWMLSTFNYKTIKSEGNFLFFIAIKQSVSFSLIGELSKIMPVACLDCKKYQAFRNLRLLSYKIWACT